MEQVALEFAPIARARRSDADSSRAAAKRMHEAGADSEQCRQVLALVIKTPGLTSAELAERHHVDRTMLARRLADLRRFGKVLPNKGIDGMSRTCTVKKTMALIWSPSSSD